MWQLSFIVSLPPSLQCIAQHQTESADTGEKSYAPQAIDRVISYSQITAGSPLRDPALEMQESLVPEILNH